MSESKELSPAQKLVGDFAPKLAELTDAGVCERSVSEAIQLGIV